MENSYISFGSQVVGTGRPTFIIAEMACAHEGDVETAEAIVDAAIEAKASAVKFQVFTADGLVVPGHELHAAYKRFEFSQDQWGVLARRARTGGLVVLVDVFEPASLNVAEAIDAEGLKVHSTNVTNPYFLEEVAQRGLPVIIGTGGTYKKEIHSAVEIFRRRNVDIALMHGFQGYPTSAADENLRRICDLARDFGLVVGFTTHADGGGDGAIWRNVLAVGMGCPLLETHITMDRSPDKTDYHSSLEPEAFKRMVSVIREMEVVLGTGGYEMNQAEKGYRKSFKAFIVSAGDLPSGHRLELADMAFKRASHGIVPSKADRLLGRYLKHPVSKDEPLTEELVVDDKKED